MNASHLQKVKAVSKQTQLRVKELIQCKKILKGNHDMEVKTFQSLKINYLFLHSNLEINGIDELEFFWALMFDSNVDVNIKQYLEESFMKSLVYWSQYYNHIFEEGLEKSIDLFKKIIELQSRNGTILQSKIILYKTDFQYFIQMKDDSNPIKIFKNLQFIAKCCLKTTKLSSLIQNRFKDIAKIALKILNIGMNILSPNQAQKQIIKTANEIVEVCLQIRLSNQQKMALIEDLCKYTNLNQLILSVYNSGADYGVKKDRESSWIALKLSNLQQQQQYLRNKISIAAVHLKYMGLFSQNYHFNMNFLCNQQQFLKTLLNTIYNFTTITKNYQNYEAKDEFISYLLEIYLNYFIKNPSKFDKIQHGMIKIFIIPLLIVQTEYYQHMLMKDPTNFLYYLQEIYVQQQLNVASVKASKMLRIIIERKQIMEKLVQSILSKLENSFNKTQFLEFQQINYETVWLVLLAITPKLKQQQNVIRKILAILGNNKQLFVSNIGLCIIIYFVHNVPEYHCQMKVIINNLLREILQRQCPQLLMFLFQLLSNQQCCIDSLYLVQISYRMLLVQKTIKNKEICWKLFHRSINFHIKQIPQKELKKMMNQFILPRLQILQSSSLETKTAYSLYQFLKLIYNLLQNCKQEQVPIIQHSFLKLSTLFERILHLGFDQQLLHTITLYFTKIDKVRAEHNPFLRLILQRLYKQSFSSKQANSIYLSFCKNLLKIPFQQQSINPLLLVSQTIIHNAKQYNNTIQLSGFEEQIYESLLIQEEIIHRLAEDSPKHLKEQICKILVKWNNVYNKRLYLRMANVIISCRIYSIPHSFCWHQAENMVIQCEISHEEVLKLIANFQNLLGRAKPIRSPKDYAFILNILYKIIQKYQRNQQKNLQSNANNQILQQTKAKIYQIFTIIFKRKRIVINQIKQQLTLKSSLYYHQLQLQLQKQASKEYPIQYLSMIF